MIRHESPHQEFFLVVVVVAFLVARSLFWPPRWSRSRSRQFRGVRHRPWRFFHPTKVPAVCPLRSMKSHVGKRCPIYCFLQRRNLNLKHVGFRVFENTWNNSDHTREKEQKVSTYLCAHTSRRRHTIPRTNPKLALSQEQQQQQPLLRWAAKRRRGTGDAGRKGEKRTNRITSTRKLGTRST